MPPTTKQKYSYMNKAGGQSDIEASSADEALKAPDIAANSGVITPSLSPTVITDANIRENVIPDVKNRMMKYSKSSTTTPTPGDKETKDDAGSIESPYSDYTSLLETSGMEGTSAKDIDNATLNDPGYQRFNEIYTRAQQSNDSQYKAALESIKLNTNKMRQRAAQGSQALNASLINTGATRYAPGGAIGAGTKYDLDRMEEIQANEELAIAKATEAFNSNDMQLAQDMLNQVDTIRQEKRDVANKINEKLIEENKKAREAEFQASRDNAVVGLLTQGITDPLTILDYLNNDEQGNQIGDFSAEEVSGIMEKIAKANDYNSVDKLSSDFRDFFILKQMNQLPADIAGLSEEQQLNAFINKYGPKKTGSTSGPKKKTVVSGNFVVSADVMSAAEQALDASRGEDGYANSEVYKAAADDWLENGGLLKDFKTHFPPANYTNPNDSSLPSYLRSSNSAAPKTDKNEEGANNAKAYFKNKYGEVVDDVVAEQLADRVRLYMEGGKSYAAAVKLVEDEATKD